MVVIYPQQVHPHHNKKDWIPGEDKYYQGMSNPGALCNDDVNIAWWGERYPSTDGYANSLYWYGNTITSLSGSYNLPTSFSTQGWQDSTGEFNNIRGTAIVKKITLEYAIANVQYSNQNTNNIYESEGAIFYYNELSGGRTNAAKNAQTPYTFTLSGFGQNRSVSGQGLSVHNLTYKNRDVYDDSIIPTYSSVLYEGYDKNLTIDALRNSSLTVVLPRNINYDVGRIVMRYVRLRVEYEAIPPTFQIHDIVFMNKWTSKTVDSITTCEDSFAVLGIRIHSTNKIIDKTRIKISGTAYTHADYFEFYEEEGFSPKGGGDTLTKNTNDSVWSVVTFAPEEYDSNIYFANVLLKTRYNNPGVYNVTATVLDHRDSQNYQKSTSITVKPCKPNIDFAFLDSNNNEMQRPYTYVDTDNTQGKFKITISKNQMFDHNEQIIFDSGGLELVLNTKPTNATVKKEGNLYKISNIKNDRDIVVIFDTVFSVSGQYKTNIYYKNADEPSWDTNESYDITVKGSILPKEYFKLRLEDGTDVRYNSLMVTQGDDLLQPLYYDIHDIESYLEDITIVGEKKRIPVGETQYIYFDINFNTNQDITLKKVLTYIEIDSPDNNADDIIVGASKNVSLLEMGQDKICSIESIQSNTTTRIKFAVKSEIEIDDVQIKIKPYNYDEKYTTGEWLPSYITFKNIPNVKISIDGISDLMCENYNDDNDECYFWLYYHIQNLSTTAGTNVRFQLKEPSQFRKVDYIFAQENVEDELSPYFNEYNRIISFPYLEANSADYIIAVKYKATRKGVYNFIIHTLDDENTLEDDQYQNSYQHTLMVNITSDVKIVTSVSNSMPYIDELIDFNIDVLNKYKQQKYFTFDIYDIGSYDVNHTENHYEIEYENYENGVFSPAKDNNYQYPNSHTNNKVGHWRLDDIGINDQYNLTLSVRPRDIGNHIFKTVFTDYQGNSKEFYNEVKVLERKKQISFNVYHAIDESGINNCHNCRDLTPICDDDFINLKDDIYYVFEVQNHSRKPITNAIYVYARLPKSFLTNGILCSSKKYEISKANDLIGFTIPKLQGCEHEDSKITFCMKVKPSEIGTYISNFSLSTRNADVLHKKLQLTVDTEFNNRAIEHEINIYNFDKTNKYYRYEIDNIGDIFKFYNIGDKSYRMIDIENFKQGSIETYKGTNLKKILSDIKKQSKFVEPLFFRTGNNHIADKAYELYPDGFIRRFGLLNSEVFHYSGQLPVTSNLVDRAMIWDIDKWDTKVWAGDIYDNGVFDLTIDYNKVPSNFNILDVDRPIQNLQALVDNVKPFGSKAICYYSASVEASLGMNIDNVHTTTGYKIQTPLRILDDFDIISLYNRHDNTIVVNHDLTKLNLKTDINNIKDYIKMKDSKTKIGLKNNEVTTSVYGDKISKTYANECYDLISNAYNESSISKNIDITKPYDIASYNKSITNHNITIIACNNDLLNKESIDVKIYPFKGDIYVHSAVDDSETTANDIITFKFTRDDINHFTGFKIITKEGIVQERNFFEDIKNFNMQVQIIKENTYQVIHFWGSINNEQYYHIGHMLLTDFNNPRIKIENNTTSAQYTQNTTNKDAPLTFQISDKVKTLNKDFSIIKGIEKKNKWAHLNRINKKNQYASFANNIDIDAVCDNKQEINVPKLVLKYDNFNINNLDEIVDIHFKIKAQSNKEKYEDSININVFKDGDACLPVNNTSRQMWYPKTISNINKEFLTTVNIEQNNITICSDCLKTSLGYYDKCPYCDSPHVLHYNQTTPATACYNCGWIINGWNDYCHHCLSYNTKKIQIDFNKTYCADCNTMHDDYYEYCPHCFSKNVMHLTNNIKRYELFSDKIQNIEPINIKIDADMINAFNLDIPLNAYTSELKKLSKLELKVSGTNHNNGKYYHCEACGHGGLGNHSKCPYCNSKLIHNEQANNTVLETYARMTSTNQEDNAIISIDSFNDNDFEAIINLKECALKNYRDKLTLIFNVENKKYNDTLNKILNLEINDEDIDEIINGIMPLNFTVDNISLESKYKDEREWIGLDKLEGQNHTYIQYNVPNNVDMADTISFNDFSIDTGEYQHAYLYIAGLIKSRGRDIKPLTMHIKIINDDTVKDKYVTIDEDLFNKTIDIIDVIPEPYLNNTSIQVSFENLKYVQSILITDCNITTEKVQYDENIHDDVNVINAQVYKEKNDLLFTSLNNNLWGLNDTQPYYMSGKQLDTSLICYIDFGTLGLQEYIRVYDIEMIVYYKAKSGRITTDIISSTETTKTRNKLLSIAALEEEDTEQLLSGTVNKKNGELLGSINFPNTILNNLEYNVTTVNEEDELVNDIPLRNKIAQAFTIDSATISTIHFNYYGKSGYPSEIINAYLCKDDNGKPGAIIESNKIFIPTSSNKAVSVDIDSYNLNANQQYWIVLEDKSANDNNYHRFKYNNKNIGELLIYKDDVLLYDSHSALSCSIDNIQKSNNFYNLPTSYKFNDNKFDGYKVHYIFYRYNINETSNVTLSELNIKNGYKLRG